MRARREQLGLTIRDVAAKAQTGVATVHALENGRLQLQVDNFLAILDALDLSAADVLPEGGHAAQLPLTAFQEALIEHAKRDLPQLIEDVAEAAKAAQGRAGRRGRRPKAPR